MKSRPVRIPSVKYRVNRPPERTNETSATSLAQTWEALKFVASTTALLAALLYYFGWVRTQATYGYFGVDTGLLGFSTPDYLLRSVNSALPPAVGAGLLILGLVSLRRWLLTTFMGHARADRRLRWIAIGMRIGAVLLLSVAAAGIIAQNDVGRPLGILLPLTLPTAAVLLTFTPQAVEGSAWTFLVVVLAFFGLMWAVALYAGGIGQRAASGIAGNIAARSDVVLYSAERLSIAGAGVAVATLPADGSKYRYRYSGLKMLVYANDRYFLLPMGWQKGRDNVFVIEKGDDVRIDIHARG